MYMSRKAGMHLLLTKHRGWRLSILQHRGTPPMYYRICVGFAWCGQLDREFDHKVKTLASRSLECLEVAHSE